MSESDLKEKEKDEDYFTILEKPKKSSISQVINSNDYCLRISGNNPLKSNNKRSKSKIIYNKYKEVNKARTKLLESIGMDFEQKPKDFKLKFKSLNLKKYHSTKTIANESSVQDDDPPKFDKKKKIELIEKYFKFNISNINTNSNNNLTTVTKKKTSFNSYSNNNHFRVNNYNENKNIVKSNNNTIIVENADEEKNINIIEENINDCNSTNNSINNNCLNCNDNITFDTKDLNKFNSNNLSSNEVSNLSLKNNTDSFKNADQNTNLTEDQANIKNKHTSIKYLSKLAYSIKYKTQSEHPSSNLLNNIAEKCEINNSSAANTNITMTSKCSNFQKEMQSKLSEISELKKGLDFEDNNFFGKSDENRQIDCFDHGESNSNNNSISNLSFNYNTSNNNVNSHKQSLNIDNNSVNNSIQMKVSIKKLQNKSSFKNSLIKGTTEIASNADNSNINNIRNRDSYNNNTSTDNINTNSNNKRSILKLCNRGSTESVTSGIEFLTSNLVHFKQSNNTVTKVSDEKLLNKKIILKDSSNNVEKYTGKTTNGILSCKDKEERFNQSSIREINNFRSTNVVSNQKLFNINNISNMNDKKVSFNFTHNIIENNYIADTNNLVNNNEYNTKTLMKTNNYNIKHNNNNDDKGNSSYRIKKKNSNSNNELSINSTYNVKDFQGNYNSVSNLNNNISISKDNNNNSNVNNNKVKNLSTLINYKFKNLPIEIDNKSHMESSSYTEDSSFDIQYEDNKSEIFRSSLNNNITSNDKNKKSNLSKFDSSSPKKQKHILSKNNNTMIKLSKTVSKTPIKSKNKSTKNYLNTCKSNNDGKLKYSSNYTDYFSSIGDNSNIILKEINNLSSKITNSNKDVNTKNAQISFKGINNQFDLKGEDISKDEDDDDFNDNNLKGNITHNNDKKYNYCNIHSQRSNISKNNNKNYYIIGNNEEECDDEFDINNYNTKTSTFCFGKNNNKNTSINNSENNENMEIIENTSKRDRVKSSNACDLNLFSGISRKTTKWKSVVDDKILNKNQRKFSNKTPYAKLKDLGKEDLNTIKIDKDKSLKQKKSKGTNNINNIDNVESFVINDYLDIGINNFNNINSNNDYLYDDTTNNNENYSENSDDNYIINSNTINYNKYSDNTIKNKNNKQDSSNEPHHLDLLANLIQHYSPLTKKHKGKHSLSMNCSNSKNNNIKINANDKKKIIINNNKTNISNSINDNIDADIEGKENNNSISRLKSNDYNNTSDYSNASPIKLSNKLIQSEKETSELSPYMSKSGYKRLVENNENTLYSFSPEQKQDERIKAEFGKYCNGIINLIPCEMPNNSTTPKKKSIKKIFS